MGFEQQPYTILLSSLGSMSTKSEGFTWLGWSQKLSVALKIMAWKVESNTWRYNYVQLD